MLNAILKSRSADNDRALIDQDQGSQADHELAACKGITQRVWELANEPQPESESQTSPGEDV